MKTVREILKTCVAASLISGCGISGPSDTVADLNFITQPVDGVAGTIMATVRVQLLNDQGDVLTNATDSVQMTVVGAFLLTGTLKVQAADGVANFTDLMISPSGMGYKLLAVVGRVTRESASFDM